MHVIPLSYLRLSFTDFVTLILSVCIITDVIVAKIILSFSTRKDESLMFVWLSWEMPIAGEGWVGGGEANW